MFWGLVLEPGKRYSTIVEKSFHLSKAALDCASVRKDNEFLSVLIETEEHENILCTLSKEKGILQANLDLNFMTGDKIAFECKGSGNVHLSGFLAPDDFGLGDEELEEEEKEDESEVDSEAETVSSAPPKKIQAKPEKRKADVPPPQQNKKKKPLEPEESDLDSDDEDSDEDGEMGSDLSNEEEELNEDEAEEESEEDTEEEQPVTPQMTKQQKKQQQKNNTSQVKQPQTPGKQNKSIVNGVTPNQQQSGKKDKKKGQTPQQQTPGQNATPKANKTPNANEEGSPKKRVIEGGVVVKDIRVGNGQPAKPGKMVQVYYTGRLKSNNKVFDSTNKGDGFKFRLGKGEVIKGWDIGLNGMKVGGKRVITCPANVAYGSAGSPPTIPPNSTLIFEVELKGIN